LFYKYVTILQQLLYIYIRHLITSLFFHHHLQIALSKILI